jgi:amidase
MQLVGPRLGDREVLAACAAVERELPWAESYPPRGLGGDR